MFDYLTRSNVGLPDLFVYFLSECIITDQKITITLSSMYNLKWVFKTTGVQGHSVSPRTFLKFFLPFPLFTKRECTPFSGIGSRSTELFRQQWNSNPRISSANDSKLSACPSPDWFGWFGSVAHHDMFTHHPAKPLWNMIKASMTWLSSNLAYVDDLSVYIQNDRQLDFARKGHGNIVKWINLTHFTISRIIWEFY